MSIQNMRAWRVHAFGPPDVMTLESVPRPQPGEGEVLVRVEAAGVGPWDALIRAGRSALPQPLPLTPGSDLSGVIVASGSRVAALREGDPVYGVTNPRFVGAYADYAVANVAMLARKPAMLAHVDAAAVPVVAVTAWQALDHAKLRAGQTAVVLGAAGSVGRFVLQLARERGVNTVAVVGAGDVSLASALGASTVIDYRAQRLEDHVRDAEAVIDLVGGDAQARAFAILRRGGRLISAAAPPDQRLASGRGVEAKFFLVDVTRRCLEMLEGTCPRPKGKIVLATGGRSVP